ncbi:hypothetical protein FGO68_gene16198 [Halteria grandinella]|uniref:Uncharacterized protein n=1 Tax=Halteria grandinella TaxID=5974 RepID=A0A8J8NLS4_HALGN|nr:hypothetical protein FGO68_gene16198 [Halteria grandinella]
MKVPSFTHVMLVTLLFANLHSTDATTDTKCYLCFNESLFTKYCMLSMDGTTGKCCLSDSADDCLKDQYFCTDKITTSFTYHKYAFCSFNANLCGNTKRTLTAKMTAQTIYTSLDFSLYDVCPYYIVSDTDLPFNTNVEITLNTAQNADVYVLLGSSVEKLSSQQRLQAGDTLTFKATEFAMLVVKSTFDSPFATFTYKNVQVINNAGFIGIMIGASVGYFLLLFIAVIFLSKFYIRRHLREMQQPNIVYFLKKKVLQYLRGVSNEEEVKRIVMPPPPPPPPAPQPRRDYPMQPPGPGRYDEPRYTPLKDEKKPYDQLIIPPPMPVEDFDDKFNQMTIQPPDQDRIRTASDIKPAMGGPEFGMSAANNQQDFGVTHAVTSSSQQEKPKVQIKPYKFTFD